MEIIQPFLVQTYPQLQNLYQDFQEIICVSPGSSSNHQTWEGGYVGHIYEICRIAQVQFSALQRIRPLPFELHKAYAVLFFHDIEKPFKYVANNSKWTEILKDQGEKEFKKQLIEKYQIPFTSEELNAIQYIHGEGNDYQKGKRVMNELATFCHSCDVISARIWFDHPRSSVSD